MIVTFACILTMLLAAVRPLQRNVFFLIYFGLMVGSSYFLEKCGIKYAPFSKESFLIFLPMHFILINFVTMLAYGVDKRAAKRGDWRIPEFQLHLLELLGGSPAAFVSQKLFHHKTKKRSYQISFWFVLAIQVVIIYYVLKILHIF